MQIADVALNRPLKAHCTNQHMLHDVDVFSLLLDCAFGDFPLHPFYSVVWPFSTEIEVRPHPFDLGVCVTEKLPEKRKKVTRGEIRRTSFGKPDGASAGFPRCTVPMRGLVC